MPPFKHLYTFILLTTIVQRSLQYKFSIKRETDPMTMKYIDVIYKDGAKVKKCFKNETALVQGDNISCVNDKEVTAVLENNCAYEKYKEVTITSSNFKCNFTGYILQDIHTKTWLPLKNMTCFQLIKGKLEHNCQQPKLNGRMVKITSFCKPISRTFCSILTLPGNVSVENVKTVSTIPINTYNFPNTTTTKTTTKNITMPSVPIVPRSTTIKTATMLLPSSSTTPKTTSKANTTGDSNSVLWYAILSGSIVLFILLVCLVYFLCYRKRKQKKVKTDPLLEMVLIDDAFDKDIKIEELYAKPHKLKKKSLFRSEKEKELLKDYDEVGGIIEGTYEAQDSVSTAEDKRYGANATDTAKLKTFSSTGIDDPYEILGRSNSFSPIPKRDESQKSPQLKLVGCSTQPDVKPVDLPRGSPVQSVFKPGSSMRIKQQRTSTRRGKQSKDAKENLLQNFTYEQVNITPPVSIRSSPEMDKIKSRSATQITMATNATDNSFPETNSNEKVKSTSENNLSPKISEETEKIHSYEDILDIIDGTNTKTVGENKDSPDKDNSQNDLAKMTAEIKINSYEDILNIINGNENIADGNKTETVDNKTEIVGKDKDSFGKMLHDAKHDKIENDEDMKVESPPMENGSRFMQM